MSQRVLTILLVVLGISAVARLIFTGRIIAPSPQASEVIVAVRKLEIGTLVKETDLYSAPWVGPAPLGVVLKKEDAAGRGVVSTIYDGEPIQNSRLAAAASASQGPEQ